MTTLRLFLPLGLGALLFLTGCQTHSTPAAFTQWPAGTSPAEVGKRVAENFQARSFQWQTEPKRKYVIYPEVCAWYGSLEVAHLIADADLQKRLIAKYDVLLTEEGAQKISPKTTWTTACSAWCRWKSIC